MRINQPCSPSFSLKKNKKETVAGVKKNGSSTRRIERRLHLDETEWERQFRGATKGAVFLSR